MKITEEQQTNRKSIFHIEQDFISYVNKQIIGPAQIKSY